MKQYKHIPILEFRLEDVRPYVYIENRRYLCPWEQDLRDYNLFIAKDDNSVKEGGLEIEEGIVWGDLYETLPCY